MRAGLFAPLCNGCALISCLLWVSFQLSHRLTLRPASNVHLGFPICLDLKHIIQSFRHQAFPCPSLSKRPLITTQRICSLINGWNIATLATMLIMSGLKMFGSANMLILGNKLLLGIKGISYQKMSFVALWTPGVWFLSIGHGLHMSIIIIPCRKGSYLWCLWFLRWCAILLGPNNILNLKLS